MKKFTKMSPDDTLVLMSIQYFCLFYRNNIVQEFFFCSNLKLYYFFMNQYKFSNKYISKVNVHIIIHK